MRTLTRQVHFQGGLLQRRQRLARHGERHNLKLSETEAGLQSRSGPCCTHAREDSSGDERRLPETRRDNADGKTENENPC